MTPDRIERAKGMARILESGLTPNKSTVAALIRELLADNQALAEALQQLLATLKRADGLADELRDYTHDWDWKYGEYWDSQASEIGMAITRAESLAALREPAGTIHALREFLGEAIDLVESGQLIPSPTADARNLQMALEEWRAIVKGTEPTQESGAGEGRIADKPRREYLTGAQYERVLPHIKQFERTVWFGGMFHHVNATSCRGQTGSADGLDLLVWTCAGRTMITIRDGTGDWLSLMVAEDSTTSTMGLHERSVDDAKLIDWLSRLCSHYRGVTDSESVTLDVFLPAPPDAGEKP